MSLKAIKTKNKGFTIVELLIVVVVIAILAAITIVSYNGITRQANASAADSLVATWRKKIELFYASEGTYPFAETSLSGDPGESYYIPVTSLKTTAPNSSDGTQKVMIEPCGSSAPTTDATTTTLRVTYWDYEANATATTLVGGSHTTCAAAWG